MDLEGLRLREINLFLDLVNTKSIRELARQRGELPGQISKAIRSLELKLGNTLINRSTLGVSLTTYAVEILPYLEGIRNYQQRLDGHFEHKERLSTLTFATTSFFSTHFVPPLLGQLEKIAPDVHCRLLDLPPSQFIPVALRNGFEICVHINRQDWPRTWTSIEVGQIRWQLWARKKHPLGKSPTMAAALAYPFVYPIYWTNDGLRQGDDNFPTPIKKRIKGYETATAASAAQVAARTDQLAYLPNLVAEPLAQQGLLQVLDIPTLRSVHQPVYLSVKSDVIRQQRFLWIKEQCRRLLQFEE